MSDDYASYYLYKELGFDRLPCVVVGEAGREFVLQKSEPYKPPPPTAEILQ